MTYFLRFLFLVPLLVLMIGCRKEADADPRVVPGQNRFTVEVDGISGYLKLQTSDSSLGKKLDVISRF